MLDALRIHSSAQIVLDDPVNLQIRITADRRGEMAVIGRCQSEMPGVYGAVLCLLHRAECQPAD